MHASELVQLSALLAVHGQAIVRSGKSWDDLSVEQYWSISKCRIDRWTRSIKVFQAAVDERREASHQAWRRLRPAVEEMMLSEMPARVFAAVGTALDGVRGEQQLEPVLQSVLGGHLEIRHRVLQLLARQPDADLSDVVTLNLLRRRVERWTDMLLSNLQQAFDVREFAVHEATLLELAGDLEFERQHRSTRRAWELMLASLRAAFRYDATAAPANADLNQRLAASIVGCVRGELTDAAGQMQSLWLLRLYQTTEETQGMIDQLLRLDDRPVKRF